MKKTLLDLMVKHANEPEVLVLIPYPSMDSNYDPTSSVFEPAIRELDKDGLFKEVWRYSVGDRDPTLRTWLIQPGTPVPTDADITFPPGMIVCISVCWVFCLLTTHPMFPFRDRKGLPIDTWKNTECLHTKKTKGMITSLFSLFRFTIPSVCV